MQRIGIGPLNLKLPLIPGHEGLGYVVALGEGVDYIKEGDIVGVPWLYSACGHCEHCTTGWETLCESQKNGGYSVDGGYAEYVIADARYVGHLPTGINFTNMAPILCAGVTVYKGLKETEVKPGQWVAISGIGGLGHVADKNHGVPLTFVIPGLQIPKHFCFTVKHYQQLKN